MSVLRELGAPVGASLRSSTARKSVLRDAGAPDALRRRRTVLGLLVLASATVMVIDSAGAFNGARSVAATVTGPGTAAAHALWSPVEHARESLTRGAQLQAENAELRARVAQLSGVANSHDYATTRAGELDKLLKVASVSGYHLVPAQVIGYSTVPGTGQTVSLDAGTRDGVHANMTVLSGAGLVGRVVAASPSSATVVLLTDARSSIGARLEKSNALGFVTGNGSVGSRATLTYTAIDPATKPVVGQRLVTWGSKNNAPYVPGVPIGTVISVKPLAGTMSTQATVAPFVTTTSLDVVAVVTGPVTRDPRDAIVGQTR